MLKNGLLSLFISLCIVANALAATTLYLDDRLDLLVLDGKKVASSLLRGAGSLELENGLHQLVVSLDDPSIPGIKPTVVEILTVDTRHIQQLHFSLPSPLTAPQITASRIDLHDEHGRLIHVVRDKLAHVQTGMADCFEKAMLHYNQSSAIAAHKEFAQGAHRVDCPAAPAP